MKLQRALMFAALATILGVASYSHACPGKDKKDSSVAKIDVDDAAQKAKSGKVIMVDANSKKVREKEGVVPGARLISNYREYKPSDLGAKKDDTLVFYCHSEACSAAPKAAAKASGSGFKVKVMDAGIVGWKKAGHPVKHI